MTRVSTPARPDWTPVRARSESSAAAARRAYDTFASAYDAFTADYPYERLLDVIEELAERHGLPGRRLFDVACGTGRSFAPMLTRGYHVWAVDISPAMVRRAKRRLGTRADRVVVADMRALPDAGPFDLVTCLDDAVNYLHTPADLAAAFAGVARNLAPGGIYVFDVNSLATYRNAFAGVHAQDCGDTHVTLVGRTPEDVSAGALCEARMHIRQRLPQGGWRRRTCTHVQRHWPVARIVEALERAGLECVEQIGLLPGPTPDGEPDELRHTKSLFVARRP
jgi:SAM-dependent methyltransferase